MRSRRAIIVPLIILGMVVFMSMLALIVDGGLMFLEQYKLRTYCEAASLIAVRFAQSSREARDIVSEYLRVNGKEYNARVRFSLTPDGGRSVSVALEHSVSLLLSSRVKSGRVPVRCVSRALLKGGHVRLIP